MTPQEWPTEWAGRPLLMPEAHAFADVLEYVAEWDHETMSHRAGVLPAGSPRPAPRYVGGNGIGRELAAIAGLPAPAGDSNELGPYCSVDLSQLGGPRHRGIAIRATDAVVAALEPRIVTPDDHLSFELIAHESTGRVLVIARHGYISGSHYLAIIDPDTIPAYPFEARDARVRELCDAIRGAEGDHVPFRKDHPGGAVTISSRTIPGISATVHPDGSVLRRWADGLEAFEPAPGGAR